MDGSESNIEVRIETSKEAIVARRGGNVVAQARRRGRWWACDAPTNARGTVWLRARTDAQDWVETACMATGAVLRGA